MRLRTFLVLSIFAGGLTSVCSRADTAPNPFGKDSADPGESALVGIFYDLKQKQDHTPVAMDHPTYFKIQEDFINGGWNEEILNKFYRASKPLYTTQFFLPERGSDLAPKAFGVEKYCQGGFWLAHYKGQVTPPHDGTYRFVGWADCQIMVAVNGKLAMVSSYWKDMPKLDCASERVSAPYPGGESLKAGPWLNLKASDPVDLDVLWGDNGGACSCYLLVQEKGVSYEMDNGYPILPIFQVAPYDTEYPPGPDQPKYSHTPCVWKALQ